MPQVQNTGGSQGAGDAGGAKPAETKKGGVQQGAVSKLPRKRFFRARAHSNPLSDSMMLGVPDDPSQMNWAPHFPEIYKEAEEKGEEPPKVRFADIGCGFGGLLMNLATTYPDTLMVGMELRDKVSLYVKERIWALRRENPGQYKNCTCMRANAMKFLPHYFEKGQLTKMFFLFPDPHFKAANHRRRIINTTLITEYAYLMAPSGWLYTVTDVKDLGDWMREKMSAHPMFERVSDEELAADPANKLLTTSSEEGQKVARNAGNTYIAVFRRLEAPKWSNLPPVAP